ncbi:unnamed protein product [Linum tenue]|uniref:Uncharacterized protein n=1 Tax=Linum tenue TaxID=586396 RepID=A0AAV0LWI7_9ROSI|nr:unnamed protein product [Linum tenue]
MTPGISYRLLQNPGWSRFFVTTLFATAYCAAISNVAAVAGQSSSNNATVAMNVGSISDSDGSRTNNTTTRAVINTTNSSRDGVVEAAAADSDIAGAAVNVVEGDKQTKIEEARIGKNNRRCKESSTSVASENKRWLNSFRSLFLIAGMAAVLAICVFIVVFVYKHGKLVLPQEDDSQWKPSFWRRSQDLFRTFDTKDLKCRTIRDDRVCSDVHLANVNALSPSTYSVRLEFPADSPETPTLMMESLWIRPEDLLR